MNGIKRFIRDKENITRIISFLGLVVSIYSLWLSIQTNKRQDEIQASLATPTVNLSVQLSDDKCRYSKVNIISDGKVKNSVEITTYPYLRTTYSISDENFPEDWIVTYKYVSLGFTSVHQFLIPIIPSYEFFDLEQENAKDGVIASIQESQYSLLISDHIIGAKDFLKDNYGMANLSFSLEYFVELKYSNLLGDEYCDVYKVVTGVFEGVNTQPSFELIEGGLLVHDDVTPSESTTDSGNSYFEIDFVRPDFKSVYHFLKNEIESYEHYEIPIANSYPEYRSSENSHSNSVLWVGTPKEKEDIYSLLSGIIFEHQKNIAEKYDVTIQTTQ